MPTKIMRPVIAIGDAHGEYHSFAAVLIHAGLMDAELTWTGKKTILVQTGDILDRGSDALQIDKLLDILQPMARKAGGDIIRLIGNHELEILRKNYFITSLPYFQIAPFRDKLIEGILSGAWQAAYSCRGFLITHAGVCDSLYQILLGELGGKKVSETKIAAHINKIVKDAVAEGSFKHAVFNASYLRGGPDRFGGIFWEDLTSLFNHHSLCPLRQIVGHTVLPEITVSPDYKILAIDTGMKNVFSGKFEYLSIKSKKEIDIVKVQ